MNSIINQHGTKIYGGLTAFFGALQGLITTGAFNNLMSPAGVGWMGIISALATAVLGGMTMARGFNNSAQEKVATAMETAINAAPMKQGGFARPGFLAMLATLAIVLLSGCAGNPTVAKELGYRIVTRQAIQRYIWDAGTDEKRTARADRIRLAATALRGLASGDEIGRAHV